ncbi:MAG: ATP-binding cassette domain-containing protein [Christensenellales bacterium]|jgi:tungstate transport system ATP-binding protein
MIEINGLIKKYGEKTVLDIGNLKLERGASYALVGANGSGKTTLIRILAGALEYDKGEISFDKDACAVFMPQKNFAFDISVLGNLTLVKKDKNQALDILKSLELARLAKRRGSKLSGGETQRLALARLLMMPFNIMLLDEPTFAMDINSALIAEKVIEQKAKRKDSTLVFSTHSMQQAARLADEIIFLHQGKVCERGEARAFLSSPQTQEAQRFLQYFSG